jgi:MFS family permease
MKPASPPARGHSVWRVFAHRVFFALWIAALVSNVGTWMQNVGAAWLMTSLSPSPLMVALIQTASSLPILLLALPAGALADIVDRRRLLIVSQAWMLLAAAALGVLTIENLMTPWMLLGLSFALGVGSALNAPAWQAITPELVPPEDLTSAIALNGVNFNAARAVGPAIGGIVVAWAGAGATFVLNAVSFLGVMVVLYGWNRSQQPGVLPAERLIGAIRSGVRYVRYAPPLRAVMMRTAGFTIGAGAVWAIVPLLARRQLNLGADGFGLLLGAFGTGAIVAGAALERIEDFASRDTIVAASTAIFAAVLIGLGFSSSYAPALALMFVGGAMWVLANSSLNIAAQLSVPRWVQGRALACYQLVQQAAMAGGSVLWGFAAEHGGVPLSLVLAAITMVSGLVPMIFFHLISDDELDLDPLPLPPVPEPASHVDPESGPVLVTIEYLIRPESAREFRAAMNALRSIRLRDGAVFWGLFFDLARPERFVEYFISESWIEHMRMHGRGVSSDQELEARARAFHIGSLPPAVTHQLSAHATVERSNWLFRDLAELP